MESDCHFGDFLQLSAFLSMDTDGNDWFVEISTELRLALCHTPSTSVPFVLSYSEGLW